MSTQEAMSYARGEDPETLFRRLMDSAPVMIWVSGPDKLCTWFNKPWLEFTGRTMEQELGNGWADGVFPADLDGCLEVYNSHFDRRAHFRMKYRLRRSDGEYRWILDTGAPRYSRDGVFEGYIGSCIDIGAVKPEERAVEVAATRRDDSLEVLVRIAGNLAHDLGNLQSAFVGDLWAIRKSADDPAEVRKRAQEAEATAVHGARMIEQLLDAIRHPSKPKAVHINQLVSETRAILRGAAGERVRIETDLAADPDAAALDPAQLQAALSNLVVNARHAMPRGGTVTISTRNVIIRPETRDEPDLSPGRHIVLAVRDTGLGMGDEVRRRAFEPFFTTRDAGHGTGLGLFQVRVFARHSGGTARIESAPGQGTTVRVYLPEEGDGP